VIGLYKTEVIRHAGPWRGLDDVEYATLEWVAWFNTDRLLDRWGISLRRSTRSSFTVPRRLKQPKGYSRKPASGKPGAIQRCPRNWVNSTTSSTPYST
jgi:hypothetical protein